MTRGITFQSGVDEDPSAQPGRQPAAWELLQHGVVRNELIAD